MQKLYNRNLILMQIIFIVDIGTSAQTHATEEKLVKNIFLRHRTSEATNTFQSENQKCGN